MVGKKCSVDNRCYWPDAASLDRRRAGWARKPSTNSGLGGGLAADFDDESATGGNGTNGPPLLRHKIFDSEEELPRVFASEHDIRQQQQRQRSSSSGGRLLLDQEGRSSGKWSATLSRRTGRSSGNGGGVLAWLNLMADCDVRYKSSKSDAEDVYSGGGGAVSNRRCKHWHNSSSRTPRDEKDDENNDESRISFSDTEETSLILAAAVRPGTVETGATSSSLTRGLGRSDFVDEILESSLLHHQQLLLPHNQQQPHLMATISSSRRPRPKRRRPSGGNNSKSAGGNSKIAAAASFRPYIQSEFGEAAVLVPGGGTVEPLHLSHAMRTRHHVFHCFEFLLMRRLDEDAELWARLCERYGHCDECKGCRTTQPHPTDSRQQVEYRYRYLYCTGTSML
jgi:hypothetical protein